MYYVELKMPGNRPPGYLSIFGNDWSVTSHLDRAILFQSIGHAHDTALCVLQSDKFMPRDFAIKQIEYD